MSKPSRWFLVSLVLGLLASARTALAHPELDEAERLVRQLELEPALAAYQRALDSNTLQREELVALLSERVLVLHGMRREAERDADLTWLMAIAPMRDLDVRAPPEVVAKYRALRANSVGPLAIKLTAQATGSVEAHARLAGSVPQGTRVRIWVRSGDGMWQYEEGSSLLHVAIPGSQLELYAEALGPGGVTVAHDYSAEEPLRVSMPGALAQPAHAPDASAPSETQGWARRHRGWLIASAVLVLAAGGVATYFLVRDKDQGEPENTSVTPMVSF